jgi:hypothetical protein
MERRSDVLVLVLDDDLRRDLCHRNPGAYCGSLKECLEAYRMSLLHDVPKSYAQTTLTRDIRTIQAMFNMGLLPVCASYTVHYCAVCIVEVTQQHGE